MLWLGFALVWYISSIFVFLLLQSARTVNCSSQPPNWLTWESVSRQTPSCILCRIVRGFVSSWAVWELLSLAFPARCVWCTLRKDSGRVRLIWRELLTGTTLHCSKSSLSTASNAVRSREKGKGRRTFEYWLTWGFNDSCTCSKFEKKDLLIVFFVTFKSSYFFQSKGDDILKFFCQSCTRLFSVLWFVVVVWLVKVFVQISFFRTTFNVCLFCTSLLCFFV